jgi:LysR family glycine cleavage system transcriptional activator
MGPTFSNAGIALQSAELGHGVALGNREFNKQSIREGRIVAPFELAVPDGAYWLVARNFGKLNEAGQQFCQWIRDEMAASPT